jgi:hypothetical protein
VFPSKLGFPTGEAFEVTAAALGAVPVAVMVLGALLGGHTRIS